MTDLIVHAAEGPLRGIVPAPPHRDLAQMAAVALSLADGVSTLESRGLGELVACDALRALGVEVVSSRDGLEIHGVGLSGFRSPPAAIDAAASATVLSLVAALVTGLGHPATIQCDEAVARRHLHDVTRVLRLRGGQLEGQLLPDAPGVVLAPLEIAARDAPLSSLPQHVLRPGALPEKLAALTSGLLATGATVVIEPLVCGDAFVRLLRALGVSVETAGAITRITPLSDALAPAALPIPGDPDASLMLLAAALAHPDSVVGVRGMVSQPTDAGALAALGSVVGVAPRATVSGQATADVTTAGHAPRAVILDGESALSAGASLATLAAWAAHATEESSIVSESDNGRAVALTLAAFGVPAHHRDGALWVTGGALRRDDGATRTVDCRGDGHIAMLAAVLGLAAGGMTTIPDADCIVARFPRFVGSLRALGAHLETS